MDQNEMDDQTDLTQQTQVSNENDAQTPDDAEIPFYEQTVFGVPRLSWYGILFGFGGGLVVTGLFGMITKSQLTRSSLPGIIGAAIGYGIGAYLTHRLRKRNK